MPTLTVYIHPDSVSYDPPPTGSYPVVKPGDTVEFQLVDRTDDVTVDFGTNSPFTDSNFHVNGFTSPTYTVESVAGLHPFTGTPSQSVLPPHLKEKEQPGVVHGDLDVATESSHPPDPV